ncbi:MAG: ribonuclease III [Candidatus Neomarinimicrobiota bacterium]|nr:ribonuclease III [Candidatus Neomarinimicrobiota bacterium]MEC7854422.1 ribonuclease III [Candidatus Neomarinimicrobiota bacterium]MEC7981231.1 ribonuclease III [Candidatus Neomarinimicrobiota bacterium]MEC8689219.1 ribonuclease III [Candidatus Neomarinimicrobiota bacterium]MEC8705682.1 ribonuclease III [Candidatus Neomarinimicrobiota bacterium]
MSFFGSFFNSKASTEIEKECGYCFKDKTYLDQAFSHRSISTKPRENYERLEFLGDAVIDIVVSRELMREFPEGDEGILTQKRSALVQKSFLSSMGKLLNLIDHIKIEPNVDLAQDKIALKQAANLYEALIGAIYLDGGLKSAKKVILNTIWAHKEHAWESVNFKGKLIELCHTKQMDNPKFLVSNVSGPEHKKLFEVKVKIGNDLYPSGIGSSKKTAEQQAAQLAIDSINS